MKAKLLLLPLLLMSCHYTLADSVLDRQGGLINLTGGSITIDPNIEIEINGSMSYTDANMPWTGTGSDGVRRKISTVAYSFDGEMTGKFTRPMPNCNFQAVWVGWTVVQPGVVGVIHPTSGALYGNNYTPSAAVQTLYRVTGVLSDYEYQFRHQGTKGYIFVTDGPAGMYSGSGIPQAGGMSSAYVFSSGDRPDAYGYMDTYGGNNQCGVYLAGLVNPPIETPPIINPDPDISCNFELSYDTLDLGTVNQQTAQSATASVDVIGQCNGDSSVQLKSTPGEMEMGGLTINLRFDNGQSEKKDWKLRTDITDRTPFTATVSKVGTLVTGSYEKSGIINIIYD